MCNSGMEYKLYVGNDGTIDSYYGTFNDKKFREGVGLYIWSSGKIYIGEWKDKQMDGIGTEISERSIYVGQFKNGFAHGHGVLTFMNGNKYIGKFMNNNIHGYGESLYLGYIFIKVLEKKIRRMA
jgi:hypothetical protein